MTRIKICGITNKKDAIEAARLGVDMVGFVFYRDSKRFVEPRMAAEIAGELPPFMAKVGVFVDEDREKVLETAQTAALDILQFHGRETPEYCASFRPDLKVIKAFRINGKEDLKDINSYDVDYYLLDTFDKDCIGGTGKAFDRKVLDGFEFLRPVILSGGLTPESVEAAVREFAPYGVDVSTGVEKRPGQKDAALMVRFVDNVRKAE